MDYAAITNLPTMFYGQAASLGSKPFLWAKIDGQWTSWSYGETRDQVIKLARGLLKIGIKAGDRVVVVSDNRPEWGVADLAIMSIGAITVPAYTTNTTDDHLYILDHSGAKAAIVSTSRLARRVIPAAHSSENCGIVITIEEPKDAAAGGIDLHGWQEVMALGEADGTDIPAIAAGLAKDDTACFIYTSGTGGRPKGVMLTHRSILANCDGAYHLLKEYELGDEIFLSLLPLSHSYEHTCGLFFPISIGAQIYYCEGPDQLAANLQEVRPTIMTAVPRLYEVLHDRILRGVERQGGKSAKLFHDAVRLGRKRYEDPSSLSLWERIYNWILSKLVRKKVSQRFGGRLKAFVSGGGPLNPDIGKFFLALHVNLLQGYGQTEASPVVSANPPGRIKIHTVGPPLKGVQVKIAEDGEILVDGPLLMKGYWHDPDTTAATIKDGWLHTGDIGHIDEDGYLVITDRKKDIIVNSGGDNISPARIEGKLTMQPEILQAMVYGDKRPYLVGLIVPDESFVEEWASANGKTANLSVLAEDEGFRKAVSAAIDRVNTDLAQIEKVRRFQVATEPFTTENGMMTPTLKIRRHKIRENYYERLDRLYGKG
ncbi:long-chain fatty acid--CoA ligase [Thalassobaculum sp. OXR-137]|uniref:AMP-dependent synthetase/ligase n=1 Tax=Thalassobaculum sp. OXR-137 TaxID=3100173 RepID=UPI002AC9443F|nr:long-chain fatty acid--CoA ligase [Thalassobaculum sp. OXR-137]WPZ36064.1 long-chain fatty acid--CoA ligase [Thalassobaculum sp. OXR-137]